MDLIGGVDLFDLAERRLDWANRRQEVLAQNVANANTPGYQPSDLKPFEALVGHAAVALTATNPLHLAATSDPWLLDRSQTVAERAPDGNAVSLDEQLTKLADTGGMHQLATNLYTKYLSMFRTAIGKAG